VLAAAASAAVLAQQPRDNRAAPEDGTGALTGRVLTHDAEGRPLRKAVVTLRSDDGRTHRTAITDDGGAFRFDALPAGRYGLDASRRGWPTIAYGAARPHQRGTRIEVADGQRIGDLTLRLPRGAVLTGSVVDHTGRPMAHAAILALRFMYIHGERRLARYRVEQTDDRGFYRIYGLAAGEYLVATAGPPSAFENVGTIHATGEADVRRIQELPGPGGYARVFVDPAIVGFAPVYYPGTPFRAQALPMTLAAGEERGGLDFTVAPAQALTVQGLVDRPRGLPPAAAVRVALRTKDDELASYVGDERSTAATPGGLSSLSSSFSFASVPPGTYDVLATLEQNGVTALWSSTELTVTGEHAPRVLMSLRPALTLTGRVSFEGDAAPDVSAVRVALQRLPIGDSHVASLDASGAFAIGGLVPGRYRLSASVGGSREPRRPWSAKSFVVNKAEMLEAPLDLRSSLAGAVVTLTDRYATLSGTVLNSAGRGAPEYFVVVFPADPRLWTPLSRRIHAVRPSSEGRYLVEHLPPGAYGLAVVADIEEGEWLDRMLLQRLAGGALKFEVSEGERLVRDVRVQ
jgi:uncharacterized protein (DUF2141 family)